jgi:hypothetical protein
MSFVLTGFTPKSPSYFILRTSALALLRSAELFIALKIASESSMIWLFYGFLLEFASSEL